MICDPLFGTHFLPTAIQYSYLLLDDLEIGYFLLPAWDNRKILMPEGHADEKATQIRIDCLRRSKREVGPMRAEDRTSASSFKYNEAP